MFLPRDHEEVSKRDYGGLIRYHANLRATASGREQSLSNTGMVYCSAIIRPSLRDRPHRL
jgi:hypothetical protein